MMTLSCCDISSTSSTWLKRCPQVKTNERTNGRTDGQIEKRKKETKNKNAAFLGILLTKNKTKRESNFSGLILNICVFQM
jgi:hypothetical protein